jgi:hypothetical protein
MNLLKVHLGVGTSQEALFNKEQAQEHRATCKSSHRKDWERFAEALDRLLFYITIVFATCMVIAFPLVGFRIQASAAS